MLHTFYHNRKDCFKIRFFKFWLKKVQDCILAMDDLLLKMHVQCLSRVSLSAGGNRLCHLQEEIIDSRSDQFLAFNNNDCFFCYWGKFSHTVTSEILCIGRKSQRGAWWPKPELWPIELFWGNEVRESFFPLSWMCEASAVCVLRLCRRWTRKLTFWFKCPMCFPSSVCLGFFSWVFNASGVGLSVWKPFPPTYVFLDMKVLLGKEGRNLLGKASLFI